MHRSLFSNDAKPSRSADLAGAIQARLSALRVMQKKPLMPVAREISGKEVSESAVRSLFSDPGIAAFRPFLDSNRLQCLRLPDFVGRNALADGDILHVPFTKEEALHIIQALESNPRGFQFEKKINLATIALPGRTLRDVDRFLKSVEFFITRQLSDIPLLNHVVVYERKNFAQSIDSFRQSSAHQLVRNVELGLVGGRRPIYASSIRAGLESMCTFAQKRPDYRLNVEKYISTTSPPTDSKFSPLGATHTAMVVGCAESEPYNLTVHRLEAREDEAAVVMLYGHGQGAITELQWTVDGQYIISSGYDKFIRVWNPNDGSQFNSLALEAQGYGVIVAKQSPNLVCSRSFGMHDPSSQLMVWNINSNVATDFGAKTQFLGHVEQMCFFGARESMLVAATDGSRQSSFGEAIVWDLESEAKLFSLRPHNGGLSVVESSPSGNSFATAGSDRRVAIIDYRSKSPVVTHLFMQSKVRAARAEVNSVSFSPCGNLVQAASTQNDISIFDIRASPYIPVACLQHSFANSGFTVSTNLQDEETQGAYRTVWAPHGSILLTGGEDGCVRIWDLSRSECDANIKTLHSAGRCISSLDILHDGTAICAGNDDCLVALHTTPNASRLKFSNAHVLTQGGSKKAIRGPRPEDPFLEEDQEEEE